MDGVSPAALERSRRRVLDELDGAADLTLIHGPPCPLHDLVRAGAGELLRGREYRRAEMTELAAASGHTALIAVGNGLCRPDHDLVARAVGVAALRFERVIVLPTAVDPYEHSVRDVLTRTGATVFAGDPESYGEIAPLCDARMAHHSAFFAEFGTAGRGSGSLNAFRTDSEQRLDVPPPPDNVDISNELPDLPAWLRAIAERALIRTDRLEVVIAAAMLGKRVEFLDPGDGRLRAAAEHWLGSLPVSAISQISNPAPVGGIDLRSQRAIPRRPRSAPAMPARITVAVVTRNRPRLLAGALASLERAGAPHDVLVIDNHSSPPARAAVEALCRDRRRLRLVRLNENRRAAGGRNVAAELAETEHLLFLDDDAALRPGALGDLAGELDRHPEAAAVTATVLSANGMVQHTGGHMWCSPETVETPLLGTFVRISQDPLPMSGPAGWVPTTALLARTDLLRRVPFDPGMNAYFEDNEWCYRFSQQRPGIGFRRSREALAVHHSRFKPVTQRTFAGRSMAVEWLGALAHFYHVHDRLLGPWLFGVMPALHRRDGSVDFSGARLLMELVLRKGTDWTFAAWMNGGLTGLLRANGYG